MKRFLTGLAIVSIIIVASLAAMDGLSIRHEVEYLDPLSATDDALVVNIQNVRQSGWGGSLIESSSFGPPFDLYVVGILPPDSSATSVELRALYVTSAEGETLLAVPSVSRPVGDGETYQAGGVTPNRTYAYQAQAFTSETPSSLTVSLELVFDSPAGTTHQTLKRQLQLNRFRRI